MLQFQMKNILKTKLNAQDNNITQLSVLYYSTITKLIYLRCLRVPLRLCLKRLEYLFCNATSPKGTIA